MRNFPITFIFLFSVTFPYYSFSKWIEITSTKSESSTLHYNSTRLFKNNEFVNYWELSNYKSEEQ